MHTQSAKQLSARTYNKKKTFGAFARCRVPRQNLKVAKSGFENFGGFLSGGGGAGFEPVCPLVPPASALAQC